MQSTTPSVSFTEADTRRDAMHCAVDDWFDALATELETGDGHERVQRWLDVQATFPDDSARNAILLVLQYPDADQVATARVWEAEYERTVVSDAEPIWLWEPEYAPRCPDCQQFVADHEAGDCRYDATDPVEWQFAVFRYTPLPVVDVSQTEGRSMPDAALRAAQSATARFTRVLAAAPRLGIDLRVVDPADWSHGAERARFAGPASDRRPRVEVRRREGGPTDSVGLLRAYASARLHAVTEPSVAIAWGGDALAATVIVCEKYDIAFDAPTLSLGAWRGAGVRELRARLQRIGRVAGELSAAYRRPELLAPP